MLKLTQFLSRWFPVVLLTLIIFLFSAQPSYNLPDFDWLDRIVKKSGHMLGYGLLGFLYWRAFDFKDEKRWVAWLLAFTYAISDEWHQTFVPGRHASVWDVIVFDNLGTLVALWLANRYRKQKRPDTTRPIVQQAES